ncbi:MAG: AAA family ATPase [Planctomycetes bacterium]|nr:AAA family ATPase [Planctomycetota bacterium]
MATTIAISGKGGSGKTTISSMIVRALVEQSAGSVLAVDADPNSCLALTMGVEVEGTIAEIRDLTRDKKDNDGMDRSRFFEYGIQKIVAEAKGFDVLTMGHPEGPSCYCAANNLLRRYIDKLSNSYDFVILDNEAGMEHLSRRTTNHVDLLCIVAEPTIIGEVTAKRIAGLVSNLPIEIKQSGVIWNRADNGIAIDGIDELGCISFDQELYDIARQSNTIFDLDKDNPAFLAVKEILRTNLS